MVPSLFLAFTSAWRISPSSSVACFVLGSELALAAFLWSGDGERHTDLALYRLSGVLDLGGVRLGLPLTTGSSLYRLNSLLR